MWKRLSEEELKSARQRERQAYIAIWRPLLFGIAMFFLATASNKVGFNKYRIPEFDPITWKKLFKDGWQLPFISGAIFFFAGYLRQIAKKRPLFSGPVAMICLNCETLKNKDKKYRCKCGGEFIPIDEVEWVAEEKAGNEEDDSEPRLSTPFRNEKGKR